MTRVLFVDDEPKVLRGLQRLLLDWDCDWECEFASGGEEALSVLADHPVDVVVSDMRMPGMDGAALLSQVRTRYPGVVRMVLSGQSDRELVLKSVSAAHCYLSKPCDPDELWSVIARAVGLRELLANAQLRSVVSRLQNLPSVPRVYQEVVRRIEENDVSLRSVGDVVSQDIGMTAKILQLVNSSFFGVPRHVTDPSHAVCLLGVEVLKTLILTVHIFSELASDRLGSLGLDHLWEHCTRCGVLARRIAELEGADKNTCDSAFMAGLLHDAGKLILAANLPTECADCLALTEDGSLTPLQAELQVFGATHAEVGAYLLGIWGLPDAIVEAVAFHHRPSASRGCGFTAVTAVHVADAIEHAMHCDGTDARLETLEWPYLSRLGVSDHVSEWQEVFTVTPQAAAGVS